MLLLRVLGAAAMLMVAGRASNSDADTDRRQQIAELQLNVTDYISKEIEHDLRMRVGAAILAENYAKNPNTWLGPDGRAPCTSTHRSCPPSKYRGLDGTCNNVRHPDWGARGTPFRRLLRPDYSDGASTPRGLKQLPAAAKVTRGLHGLKTHSHEHVTSLLGVWGQMVLHDLASTKNPNSINCCQLQHTECNPDGHANICHSYMRSVPSLSSNCQFEHREQMNLATAFLDASNIYGTTQNATKLLRTLEGGHIRLEACSICRETSGVEALYSALLREHNRVATELAELNQHWDDEILFQEARRIVIAQIQHITYNEFLQTVLGEVIMETPELKLRDQGYYTGYSSSNRAGTFNGVAMSAMQVFLSMIPENLVSRTDAASYSQLVKLMLSTPAQQPSLHMAPALREGWDTGTLLLHMGRDHGLPSYQHWLQRCTPSNLTQALASSHLNVLSNIYTYVRDSSQFSDHLNF